MEESSNNGRHTLWFTTAAFSTIALVAITKSIGDITDQEKEIKWAVSAVSIPLALSGLAVFANLLLKDKFIGTFMEGGLALLTCGFWAAGMPAIMDPDNLLAVRGAAREINNNNLYFFSWGAFLMSFFVLFGFVKDAHGRGGTAATKANRCEAWAGLLATSFVMMIASSRIFDDSNCDKDQTIDLADDVCKRVKFAVALGAVSSMTSALWIMVGMFIKGRVGIMIDTMLSWLLFVMWILGITYLTFGDKAPAQTLGNLYFFTWASFGISVTMAMSSFKAMLGSMRGKTAEPPKLEPKEEIKEGQEMQEEEMGMGEMSA